MKVDLAVGQDSEIVVVILTLDEAEALAEFIMDRAEPEGDTRNRDAIRLASAIHGKIAGGH